MPDDRLTAELAKVRDRASHVNYAIATESPRQFSIALNSQSDVKRLLAAVDAILARHVPKTVTVRRMCAQHGAGTGLTVPADRAGLTLAEMFAVIDACPDCVKQPVTECAACDPVCPDDNQWPCEDYQAISRALLGEDGTDGN